MRRNLLAAAVFFGATAVAAGGVAQGFEACQSGRCADTSTAATTAAASTSARTDARGQVVRDDAPAAGLEVQNTAQAKRALALAILLGGNGHHD